MIALIDGDVIAFRCAASCEPTKIKPEREPLDVGIQRADELLYRILNDLGCSEYRLYLTGSENFRKILYPEYKANREKVRRPEWLDPIRHFLVEEWKGRIVTYGEADDGIGINSREDTIICSNDKDFFQIPGTIYDFTKPVVHNISEDDSALYFWSQMLMGDAADNLPGVPGLGKVKSKRTLEGCSPKEMESIVFRMYRDHGLNFRDMFLLYRIARSEEELERAWNEATEREKQRQAAAKTSGSQDTGDVSAPDKK